MRGNFRNINIEEEAILQRREIRIQSHSGHLQNGGHVQNGGHLQNVYKDSPI